MQTQAGPTNADPQGTEGGSWGRRLQHFQSLTECCSPGPGSHLVAVNPAPAGTANRWKGIACVPTVSTLQRFSLLKPTGLSTSRKLYSPNASSSLVWLCTAKQKATRWLPQPPPTKLLRNKLPESFRMCSSSEQYSQCPVFKNRWTALTKIRGILEYEPKAVFVEKINPSN